MFLSSLPFSRKAGTGDEGDEAEKEKITSPKYEFGGPIGAVVLMLLLPCTLYYIFYLVTKGLCLHSHNISDFINTTSDATAKIPFNNMLEMRNMLFRAFIAFSYTWDSFAALVVFVWFASHVLLDQMLVSEKHLVEISPHGESVTYRISGHLQVQYLYFCFVL